MLELAHILSGHAWPTPSPFDIHGVLAHESQGNGPITQNLLQLANEAGRTRLSEREPPNRVWRINTHHFAFLI